MKVRVDACVGGCEGARPRCRVDARVGASIQAQALENGSLVEVPALFKAGAAAGRKLSGASIAAKMGVPSRSQPCLRLALRRGASV